MSEENQGGAGTPESEDAADGATRPVKPPPSRGGRRGRGTRPMDPSRPCMNCGDPTPGEYCPTCGQRKVDVQVSVRAMLADVLEDQFIVDRRTPATLSALLFKPGYLTVEHVNGRIARYVRPFRLYLVTSVIFFVLLSFISLNMVRGAMAEPDDGAGGATPAADSVRVDSLDVEIARLDSALATMRAEGDDPDLPAGVAQALAMGRAQIERQRVRATALRDSLRAAPPRPPVPPGGSAEADANTAAAPTEDDDDNGPWLEVDYDNVNLPIARLDTAVVTRLNRLGRMEREEAIETLAGSFFNYIPTMMFVLLPVFAVVLKLLYIRRRRFYAEHFVFLLHVHSFVYILATAMLLLRDYVAGWLELLLVGWMLVYIYVAMKRVYGQGWLKTFVKYWTLGWMYFWILTISIPFAALASLLLF